MMPSRLALAALAGWSGLAVLASFFERFADAWLFSGAAIGGAMLLDGMWALRRPRLEVERNVATALPLGTNSRVRLRVSHQYGRAIHIQVHDHAPAAMQVQDLPQRVRIGAGTFAEIEYRFVAVQRGRHSFGDVEFRLRSVAALWWRRVRLARPHSVRVYPNFKAVAKYALLARDNRLAELGIHKRQRRGQGTDFHQLREYRVGDSLRQIDWRATSRLQKAISREYHDERDQQIVFMLDHGRRMHSKDGELSHLDHALNAVLLLAYVALRQGDAVGLMTFAGETRWVAPHKGPGFINVILNAVFDLQTTLVAPDIQDATEELLRRVSKRSLVIMITNVRDDPGDEFSPVLRLAQRRHVVLLASMRERILADVLDRDPRSPRDALAVASTHRYLRERERAHYRLAKSGTHCLDIEPQRLPAQLVNRYLDIKSGGLL